MGACIICGWNKNTHKHHLQRISEYGLDAEINIVELCLNHHWVADFGNQKDRDLLLLKIKKITGKEPKIDINKKQLNSKIQTIIQIIHKHGGSMSENEIAEKTGISYVTVRKYVKYLVKKGLIVRA